MSEPKATPTPGPWFQNVDMVMVSNGFDTVPICTCHHRDLTGNGGETIANAEFITRACNAHDPLLAALKALDSLFDFSTALNPGDYEIEEVDFANRVFEQARQAIARGEEPTP